MPPDERVVLRPLPAMRDLNAGRVRGDVCENESDSDGRALRKLVRRLGPLDPNEGRFESKLLRGLLPSYGRGLVERCGLRSPYDAPRSDAARGPSNSRRGAPNDLRGPPNDERPPNDLRSPPNDDLLPKRGRDGIRDVGNADSDGYSVFTKGTDERIGEVLRDSNESNRGARLSLKRDGAAEREPNDLRSPPNDERPPPREPPKRPPRSTSSYLLAAYGETEAVRAGGNSGSATTGSGLRMRRSI